MAIRRIREHAAAHNWFAVGIDLAIVVAGVFLGIQVANWNDERNEAARGGEYRDRLIQEIDFNRRQYQLQRDYYRKARSHGLAALRALRKPHSRGPDFLVDAYQATQLDEWTAKRFIYGEMLSAGIVARLGDFRIQELVSDFYLGIDGVERVLFQAAPYREAVRGAMPYAVQEAIRKQCGDRLVTAQGRVIGIALPERCQLQISPALSVEGISRIDQLSDFDVHLTRHLNGLDQKIDILQLMINQAEDTLAVLRSGPTHS